MTKKEVNFFRDIEVKEIAKTVGRGLVVVGAAIVAFSAIDKVSTTWKT